jgi:predicted transcriptional regulator
MSHLSSFAAVLAASRRKRALPDPGLCRLLRVQAGLSQAEIAQALDVSRPAVSRYESGNRTPRGEIRTRYTALLEALAKEVADG